MKHTICLIDDTIPANKYPNFINDTKIITDSALRFLVNESEWDEDAVKSVVNTLLTDQDNWSLSAFKNPSFYIGHCQEEIYNPEIIIYDWDYGQGAGSQKSEEDLLTILNSSYAIINVFTSADSENEITNLINSVTFVSYRDRLRLIKKEEEGSIVNLLAIAQERFASNFSYRFGKELKANANRSLDKILIEISKLSINQFVEYFGSPTGDGRFNITPTSLIGIISEKFKHELLNYNIATEPIAASGSTPDENLIRAIWAYRLYYLPNDNIVRKGDIIRKDGEEMLYLVLSSNCHLNNFWNKNLGYIALIPLHKLSANSSEIIDKFTATNAKKIDGFTTTSLTNSNIEGLTILPGIKNITTGVLEDFLVNPKEIFSVQVPIPEVPDIATKKFTLKLLYDYLPDYNSENRLSVSEPFISPLIEFIMDNITGYGCPDYPPSLKKFLNDNFRLANGRNV